MDLQVQIGWRRSHFWTVWSMSAAGGCEPIATALSCVVLPCRVGVTARLGHVGGQVLLATRPGLNGGWSDIVRPAVAEARELHAALALATVVLDRLTGTSPAGTEGAGNPDYFPGA